MTVADERRRRPLWQSVALGVALLAAGYLAWTVPLLIAGAVGPVSDRAGWMGASLVLGAVAAVSAGWATRAGRGGEGVRPRLAAAYFAAIMPFWIAFLADDTTHVPDEVVTGLGVIALASSCVVGYLAASWRVLMLLPLWLTAAVPADVLWMSGVFGTYDSEADESLALGVAFWMWFAAPLPAVLLALGAGVGREQRPSG